MLSRSLRSTTQVLGILALGVLTACGGGAGAPSTPPLGTSQAAALPQEKMFGRAAGPARSSYATIYSFNDEYSNGGLIALNGNLYGTTDGIIFEVSTSGTERVIYSYNISGLHAGLTAVNGNLYDTAAITTPDSGTNGSVFEVSRSGTERELYSYRGASPNGGLLEANGALYGTALGGISTPENPDAIPWGAVFELSTSGTERTLYSFKGGADGNGPNGGLIEANGALYGTTECGGGANNLGTIFEVSTSGTERVLYGFKGGADGNGPNGGLIAVNGALYGTTAGGGANNLGTIFEVSTSGTERVLYSFKGGADGGYPNGGMSYMNGALYGTTTIGGANGMGTVFKALPSFHA